MNNAMNNSMDRIKSILLALVLISGLSFYNLTGQGSVVIEKCTDFTVTGDGSSPQWNNTAWLPLAQQSPGKALYNTRVKVLYSEKGIYFLYSCEDKKLTCSLEGDFLDLYNEDVVEFFLWPDESFPVYFEYEVSPLNYELPIIIPNYQGKFFGWKPWHYEGERLTQHATSVTGGRKSGGSSVSGWMAEVFVPFKLLVPLNNVPPVSGTKWRANMYRIDYDNGPVYFAWQKIDKGFHEYNHFGTFVFR
jgi:hypothetical protein